MSDDSGVFVRFPEQAVIHASPSTPGCENPDPRMRTIRYDSQDRRDLRCAAAGEDCLELSGPWNTFVIRVEGQITT